MTEKHPLALDFATCAELSPPQLIAAAAENDCRIVSLLVQPYPAFPDPDLLGDTPMRRETRAAARSLGVKVDMIEAFALDATTDISSYRPAFESGAVLGASLVNCLVRDTDEARAADNLAKFSDLAAEYQLQPLLEFVSTASVSSLTEALRAIKRSGSKIFALEVDILHLVRSGGTPSDILAVDPIFIGRAQINDGPLKRILDSRVEALEQRMIPGTGEFPLSEFVTCLPKGVTIGVEAPLRDLIAMGLEGSERARRVIAAARALLRSCGQS